MKILFIGQLGEGQTTRMRMESLRDLGHQIIPIDSSQVWAKQRWLSRQAQQKAGRGAAVDWINDALLRAGARARPDLLWAEKQEYIHAGTLQELRRKGVRLLHYTPDPYWSLSWKRTRLMDASLPLFDIVITSKQYELDEYRRRCQRAMYMPLGYADQVHRPLVPVDPCVRQAFTCDVGFVGGWEPRRQRLLASVAGTGCDVKIWGYSWDHLLDGRWTPRRMLRLRRLAGGDTFAIRHDPRLAPAVQGGEILGDTYAWALTGARIGLGFLRTVCPDQHTTRTFEIPACGSMLLADRTDEHSEFFDEGREADFFSSEEELTDKVRFYLANEAVRERVAAAGLRRCLVSRYSYRDRLISVLQQMENG